MSKYPNSVVPEWAMEEAAAAIQWATQNHPTLGRNGWGYGGGWSDEESVATAIAFIDCSGVRVRHNVDRKVTSYSWKHRAEEWGREVGFAPYVANGDMILAALWRGVMTREDVSIGPNAFLALALPTGAAWLERARGRAPDPRRARLSDDRVEEVR